MKVRKLLLTRQSAAKPLSPYQGYGEGSTTKYPSTLGSGKLSIKNRDEDIVWSI